MTEDQEKHPRAKVKTEGNELEKLVECIDAVADVRRDQAFNAKGTSEYVPFRTAALVLDSLAAALRTHQDKG